MPSTREIVVACLDVGSVKNTGWALLDRDLALGGSNLESLVTEIAQRLAGGRRLALGFECPLFVPRRNDPTLLTGRRLGEVGVNWCGGPGGSVLAAGIVQVGWVLEQIARRVPGLVGTTRWPEFDRGEARVWIWEAFVTSRTGEPVELGEHAGVGATSHAKDALAAVIAARHRLADPGGPRSDLEEDTSSSIVAMQLIAAGLASDTRLLKEPCVVIKARKPQ